MVKELEHKHLDEDRLRKQDLFCLNKRRLRRVLVSVCNYVGRWSQTSTKSVQW